MNRVYRINILHHSIMNEAFTKQLTSIGLYPKAYLETVREIAKESGYDPNLLTYSTDDIHKLQYDGVKFGRVGYNDYIVYCWLEINGDVPNGTARKKRDNYRKRAYKTVKKTNNMYSPASLSYYLLW